MKPLPPIRSIEGLPSATLLLARLLTLTASLLFLVLPGCGTTTNRIATEQLLISDAVDQAIGRIDFHNLEGQKVFLDTQYLQSVKGVGFVNSDYIISSLRQQLTGARCFIQDSRETANIIVEPRVGALGTDGHEVVYGIPQSGSINSAAAILSSAPIPTIPEISFGKSSAQSGIAKVIVFAYDRESRKPVWQSGIAKAESTSSNTWYFGAGPFQKGSIYEGMRFAGQKLPPPPQLEGLANEHWYLEGIHDQEAEPGSIIPDALGVTPVSYGQEHLFSEDELIPAAMHPDDATDSAEEGPAQSVVTQAGYKESIDQK